MISVVPQAARAVLMVRPAAFAFNPQTSESNRFQQRLRPPPDLLGRAQREFDALAGALDARGIEVQVFAGSAERELPDEIFPNNWLSTHTDGTIVLYPMLAPNRRAERRADIVGWLQNRAEHRFERIVDLTNLEATGAFVEGTGSIVLDRVNGDAYACLSERTTPRGLAAFAARLDFETFAFDASDDHGNRIFHTNMMMSIGPDFAAVCAESIQDPDQRRYVLERLASTGRDIIEIGIEQMRAFACNILGLDSAAGPVIVLSHKALAVLTQQQRRRLERHGTLISADVDTIERFGGGGVRCMLAEIFWP